MNIVEINNNEIAQIFGGGSTLSYYSYLISDTFRSIISSPLFIFPASFGAFGILVGAGIGYCCSNSRESDAMAGAIVLGGITAAIGALLGGIALIAPRID